MSTAARKARKRERQFWHYNSTEFANSVGRPETGPFLHTQKVGTPYLERAVGPGQDHKGNPRPSKRQQKRLLNIFLAVNQPASEAQTRELVTPLELDPKPWRVGRKRYSTAEAIPILNAEDSNIMPSEIILSPRKNYEQDTSKY